MQKTGPPANPNPNPSPVAAQALDARSNSLQDINGSQLQPQLQEKESYLHRLLISILVSEFVNPLVQHIGHVRLHVDVCVIQHVDDEFTCVRHRIINAHYELGHRNVTATSHNHDTPNQLQQFRLHGRRTSKTLGRGQCTYQVIRMPLIAFTIVTRPPRNKRFRSSNSEIERSRNFRSETKDSFRNCEESRIRNLVLILRFTSCVPAQLWQESTLQIPATTCLNLGGCTVYYV